MHEVGRLLISLISFGFFGLGDKGKGAKFGFIFIPRSPFLWSELTSFWRLQNTRVCWYSTTYKSRTYSPLYFLLWSPGEQKEIFIKTLCSLPKWTCATQSQGLFGLVRFLSSRWWALIRQGGGETAKRRAFLRVRETDAFSPLSSPFFSCFLSLFWSFSHGGQNWGGGKKQKGLLPSSLTNSPPLSNDRSWRQTLPSCLRGGWLNKLTYIHILQPSIPNK